MIHNDQIYCLHAMKHRSSVAFSLFAKINFKIIVVGDKDTGKTSLILRYVKDIFNQSHSNPKGIEFYSNTLDLGGDEIALQIWDTAGSSNFKSITKSFYQQASCVIITYHDFSVLRNTVNNYLLEINEFASQSVQIVIARTKTDEFPITKEEEKVLDEISNKEDNVILWMGVSAKTGENVNNFFKTVGSALFSKYHEDQSFKELVDPKKDSFLLEEKKASSSKAKGHHCCS